MAAYDLEEQEQIDQIKAWWSTHGNWVTALVVVAALAMVGWKGWGWYQNKQSAEASVIFSALQQAHQQRDAGRIKNLSGELTEKYSGTSYAPLAALLAAQSSVSSEDMKTAKAQLSWAVENGHDEIQALARLRLAVVLLEEKSYEEALKVLAEEKNPVFASRVLLLKGDVLLAEGKRREARVAYVAAMDAFNKAPKDPGAPAASGFQRILQDKLDSLEDAV